MINGKQVLGVTLARGGSKSVPSKNIRPIAGVPLIAFTIREALKSKYIDRYVVSTDDERIAEVARGYGAEVPFMRPAHLATDTAPSGAAVHHALQFMENLGAVRYSYVTELMATNPFKTVEQIDRSIEMIDESGADAVVAVTRVFDQHPARVKQMTEDGRLVDFCVPEPLEARRQDLGPPAYIRCGSIYTTDREYPMATKARYSADNTYALVVPEKESVNVDEEIDFVVAEVLARQLGLV